MNFGKEFFSKGKISKIFLNIGTGCRFWSGIEGRFGIFSFFTAWSEALIYIFNDCENCEKCEDFKMAYEKYVFPNGSY